VGKGLAGQEAKNVKPCLMDKRAWERLRKCEAKGGGKVPAGGDTGQPMGEDVLRDMERRPTQKQKGMVRNSHVSARGIRGTEWGGRREGL